jgi:phosphatidylinositol alpha-1,6-mannosyltransferase
MKDWDPTQPASLWRYLMMLRHVRKSCCLDHITQVHCMKVLPEGVVAWALRRMTGIPYLIYAHGEEVQMRLQSRKLAWLMSLLYKGATAIVANSWNTRQLLLDIGVRPERVHVIHPGVDVAAFRAGESGGLVIRQRHNLGNAFVMLTIGRLQRRKGHDAVIKALPIVKEQISNSRYLIVGSGEEEKSLRELAASLGVVEDVVFVGSIPDEERAAYYAACDVFVMPNREVGADIEGFGIVFLEAGAAEKPVIGGASGGTADAIQDGITGIRVNGDDVGAIADAIVKLSRNTGDARCMGERGRRRVEAEFSWDSVVASTQRIVANIAAVPGDGIRARC